MKKWMIFALLLPALLLAGCAADKPSDTPSAPPETASGTAGEMAELITPVNAKPLIGTKGVTLLDVRTQEEFDSGHIEGAQLLPYDEIAQRADELPADKDGTIIVYCRSGRRSALAGQTLLALGYTSVYDLGGIQSWPYGTVLD